MASNSILRNCFWIDVEPFFKDSLFLRCAACFIDPFPVSISKRAPPFAPSNNDNEMKGSFSTYLHINYKTKKLCKKEKQESFKTWRASCNHRKRQANVNYCEMWSLRSWSISGNRLFLPMWRTLEILGQRPLNDNCETNSMELAMGILMNFRFDDEKFSSRLKRFA